MLTRVGQSKMWDALVNAIPGLRNSLTSKNYVDPIAAKDLFSLWRISSNKITKNRYKRPMTMAIASVKNMENAGLVKSRGEEVEITDKGSQVLKTMILGDDRSIFEDNGSIVDYNEALNQIKNVKVARKGRKVATNWWSRFE